MKSILLATALCTPLLASANLVTNGSFEDTQQANGTWAVYNSVNGWNTIQGTGIEVRDNVAGQAFDGKNYVELDSYSNSWMSQTIATASGLDYLLSFYYSPRMDVTADSNGIDVYWGSTLLNASPITASGLGLSAHDWQQYSFTVTGSSNGSDTLSFRAVGQNDSYGGSLDAVSLMAAAIPEPETYAMMLAGLIFIALVARGRKS